ncbi:MAG TPA: glycosyltransferase [Luteitalea sp.]|nr:glycosyltransferase [Luteitalea sp.]
MPHSLGARPPLVSVVIPCRVTTVAQLSMLEETLQSVARQSCPDHEVIVVDDGSPLDVGPVVSAHRKAFLVRQPHAGCAMARNSGIDVARGASFLFLDADDHLLPDALEQAVTALDGNPGCGFVVGSRLEMHVDGTSADTAMPDSPPETPRLYLSLLAADWEVFPASCALIRREVVEELGGFRDPWGADDLDFFLRASLKFSAETLQGTPLVRYRRYAAGTAYAVDRRLQSLSAVYERQWPLVHGHPDGERAWHTGLRRFTERCLRQLPERGASPSPLFLASAFVLGRRSEEAVPLGERVDLEAVRDVDQQALLAHRSLERA